MTQPIEPERYSVEFYVALLKRRADDDPVAFALRMIGTAAYAEHLDKAEKVHRIGNMLAAVKALPRACSDECAARPEEWPCLDDCPAQIAARNA